MLDSVQGNARLAKALAEEAGEALDGTDKDGIGGASLAAAAIELGLVDELRMFRNPTLFVAARRSFHRSPKTSRWT